MPKSKRHSVKRRYNKSLSFGKTKRGAGKGDNFKSRKENLRDASELFLPIPKTTKEPAKTLTRRITSLNFPEGDSVFDEVEQEKEQSAMTKADKEAQNYEFDKLMETAQDIKLLNDDCPDGIGCTIMGGRKSRRRKGRKGRKSRKHRKSRR